MSESVTVEAPTVTMEALPLAVAEGVPAATKEAATVEAPPAVVPESVPATAAQPDRRKMPRFPCEGTGEVIVLGGALRFTGQVRDLSQSGCCLATEVMFKLERGTQVEVVLVVNDIHFRVMGGVRSNHKVRGVGLEFMNVSTRCAGYIRDLIAELELKAKRNQKAEEASAKESLSASGASAG